MTLFLLICIGNLVASTEAFCNNRCNHREYYASADYHDETEILMNWTIKGKEIRHRVEYIEEVVNEYKQRNASTTDPFNYLSFDELPLDEYDIVPHHIHRISGFESRAAYRITYYIGHVNEFEQRWINFDRTYNFSRLDCLITETDTYCTVAYNSPYSQIGMSLVLGALVLLVFVIIIVIHDFLQDAVIGGAAGEDPMAQMTKMSKKLQEKINNHYILV